MKKQLYFSIRTVMGTSTNNAIQKVEDGDFDETHFLCDKVLPLNELIKELKKLQIPKKYMVFVPLHARKIDKAIKKENIKDGYLAFQTKHGKMIVLYTRSHARKMAKLFGGNIEELITRPNPKKHIII